MHVKALRWHQPPCRGQASTHLHLVQFACPNCLHARMSFEVSRVVQIYIYIYTYIYLTTRWAVFPGRVRIGVDGVNRSPIQAYTTLGVWRGEVTNSTRQQEVVGSSTSCFS